MSLNPPFSSQKSSLLIDSNLMPYETNPVKKRSNSHDSVSETLNSLVSDVAFSSCSNSPYGTTTFPLITTGLHPHFLTIRLARKAVVTKIHFETTNVKRVRVQTGGLKFMGFSKLEFGAVKELSHQMPYVGSENRQTFTLSLDKKHILDKGSESSQLIDMIYIAIEEGFGDFSTIWSIDVHGVKGDGDAT